MPARGTYEVTSCEEGKAAERDQSYKSCILAMLIFFLLCIILILASLPWKKFQTLNNRYGNDEESIEYARIEGQGFTTIGTERTYEMEKRRTMTNDATSQGYSKDGTTEINTVKTIEDTTRESTKVQNVSSTLEILFDSETTTTDTIESTSDSFPSTAENVDEFDRENDQPSTSTSASSIEPIVEISEKSSTSTAAKSAEIYEKSSTSGHAESSLKETLRSATISQTTTSSIADFTSLKKLLVAKYFGNESTTAKNDESMEDWLEDMQARPNEKQIESSTSSSAKVTSPASIEITTNRPVESSTTSGDVGKKFSATTKNYVEQTTNENSHEALEKAIDICQTGSCKQLASKILSYMNHSADPCDDFYEYACGGLEADEQINEKNLLQRSYEKIEKQARKEKDSEHAQLLNYYESCRKYEDNFDHYHRVNLAKESLGKVGKFYTGKIWLEDFQGFTNLFANMLLNNRPLLFDLSPDVNEKNPEKFTIRIGPAIDNDPFLSMHTHDPCKDMDVKSLQENVDLDLLYESYKYCKNDTTRVVIAISEALEDLAIFETLKNPLNITRYLEDTVTDIYHLIIEGVLKYFPSDSEIRESYRSKHYTVTTLQEIQASCTFLDWTQLIKSVTGLTLEPDAELQIYYKDELTRALRDLEEFGRKYERRLNNALLGLYARNLYEDLVATRSTGDLEKRCFSIAVNFMKSEASVLYLTSFAESEIQNMKTLMQNIFHELKETLRLEIMKSEWAVDWGRDVLLKKLEDMRMSIPDVSHINKDYYNKLNITDNYFENSMTLMKKYRSTMYSVLQKDPKDPEQIWTFFSSPYQSDPRTIYGLNLILVPYGAIDWPMLLENFRDIGYTSLATIGNLIAREIAHNFDANGVRYWNGSRDSEFALMTDGDLTKTNYEDYINCQRNSIYQEPLEMLLPLTGQRLTFTVPSMTLNDRLSDAVGMRLADDTLARLSDNALEKLLPWLNLDVSQLFYLIYAQNYCTKTELTSSYVLLHENSLLPSRIRVFAAASNNKNLGESWKCPEGSQLLPTFTCGVFPHLEYRGVMPDAA